MPSSDCGSVVKGRGSFKESFCCYRPALRSFVLFAPPTQYNLLFSVRFEQSTYSYVDMYISIMSSWGHNIISVTLST